MNLCSYLCTHFLGYHSSLVCATSVDDKNFGPPNAVWFFSKSTALQHGLMPNVQNCNCVKQVGSTCLATAFAMLCSSFCSGAQISDGSHSACGPLDRCAQLTSVGTITLTVTRLEMSTTRGRECLPPMRQLHAAANKGICLGSDGNLDYTQLSVSGQTNLQHVPTGLAVATVAIVPHSNCARVPGKTQAATSRHSIVLL